MKLRSSPTLRATRNQGFTLVELACVLATILTLTTLGITGYKQSTKTSAGMTCGNNLRILQESKRAFLEDHPVETGISSAQLAQYCPNGVLPVCPGHGTYSNTSSLTVTAICSLDSGTSDGQHNPYSPANPAPPKPIKIGPIKPGHPGGPIVIGPVETDPVEIVPDDEDVDTKR